MPTIVEDEWMASSLSSFFILMVSPTLRPCCSASTVSMATSPVALGSRPLLRVVNLVSVGTSCATTWDLLRNCLGTSSHSRSQWAPRTEATPSRAEIFLMRESSRAPSVLFALRPLWTTMAASPTDTRALVCSWVRKESEMMKAKAMRAALMATATRAAAVRRRSRREGISGPPSQWRRGCRSRTSELRWELRHGGRLVWCGCRGCGGRCRRR